MAAYRKGYSTNHVLIRLIENWRKALENSLFTAAVVGIPQNISIAKFYTYCLTFDTVTFMYSYLKKGNKL